MIERRRRAFWTLIIAGLTAFALAMAYRWFERGGAFDLDMVRVQGIRQADSSVVCQVVSPLFGRSIWQIDLTELEESLKAVSGIDSAAVRRSPMKGLILELQVSRAVFALKDSCSITPVSTRGELLPERFLTDSIPRVEATGLMDSSTAGMLADWFARTDFSEQDLVFIYSNSGMRILDDGGGEILLGRESLSDRWNAYLAMQPDLDMSLAGLQIDMRYSGQAVIRNEDMETGDERP